MQHAFQFFVGLGLGLLALAGFGWTQEQVSKVDARYFRERIAPVLTKSCVECHNPQKSRGSLDVTRREALLEGGEKGPALVVGDAQKSPLFKLCEGPNPKMPRDREPLSSQALADLQAWIDGGAPWPDDVVLSRPGKGTPKEDGWAWQPLKQPPIPTVANKDWPKNAIDHFILAMLEAKGLRPTQPADRVTLIRRLTYDLHGLPPTPQEIDAFVLDRSADALEKLIDRLLASPRYGERWGRHWLDIVHYADTHGYDKDKRRLWAWLFRDWVIRSWNQDMPYRRFLRYQLAGDHFFPNDPDGIIATGFVTAGPWDFVGHVELREGTVEKEKTRTLDRDDMVANTLSTFNSLTVHCARCHDHKSDPITMKDYYRLQAVFAGVERGDRPVLTKENLVTKTTLEDRLAKTVSQQHALEESIAKVSSPELRTIEASLHSLEKQLSNLPSPILAQPSPTNGYHSNIEPSPDRKKWVQVDLGARVALDAVRLLPARPTDFPDTPGFGFPLRFRVLLSDSADFKEDVTLIDQTKADFPNPGDQAVTIPVKGRSARFIRVSAEKLWKRTNDYIFALAELQAISEGKNLASGKEVTSLDSIEAGRWSRRHLVDGFTSRNKLADLSDPRLAQRWTLETERARLLKEREASLERAVDAKTRARLQEVSVERASLAKQLEALKSSTFVYAIKPIPPRPIHVLTRGDVDRKGELVSPGALVFVKGLDRHFADFRADAPMKTGEAARRAALADWLADDQNPLTWRSIVNRIWQYHFGRGLVDTPNDFGRNGNRPSHPELLDWLASDFRDHGDSFKRLHKMILMSATYQQASTHHPDFQKIDADNRLLWRMNRGKLDAESIRDSVLHVSGKLEFQMFGPGFDLFRFKDDHSPIYDHLDLKRINAPDTWRRTVYRTVVRSVPNPFLESLDCADPNISVPMRNQTLTPLQALAMLNNPFMVQQAEFFAERVRTAKRDAREQADFAYRLAFGRNPTDDERQPFSAFIEEHGLANACRLLLNANEFLFVD